MDASSHRLGLTLSALLFLMFFPSGAIFTAVFTYLARPLAVGGLGLTPAQVSAIAAAGALGNLAAIGLVYHLQALTCRRALAVLLTCGASLIGLLAAFMGMYAARVASSDPTTEISIGAPIGVVIVIAALLGSFTATSSAATASAATFIQQCISGTGLSYFRLRSAGTLGWVCGGASLLLVTPVSAQPIWLGCGALLVTVAYACLALPHSRESPRVNDDLHHLRDWPNGQRGLPAKELAVVLLLVGSTAALGRLYDTYGNHFLTEFKFPYPCATQPLLAQFPEFLLLLLVPFASLPAKFSLMLGPLSWVSVYLGFAGSCQLDNSAVIFLSLPLQAGNCIMQTSASIAVDSLFKASSFRRTAQAMLPFVQGAGLLLGSILAGAIVSLATSPSGKSCWSQVWLIGSFAALFATVLAIAAMAILPLDRFKKHRTQADKKNVGGIMTPNSLAETVVDG
jgi:hypothetical protein